MTKPREKTREELTAEIEDSKKKIRQYENREKMLRQKLCRSFLISSWWRCCLFWGWALSTVMVIRLKSL